MTNNSKIRNWLRQGPGVIEGNSPQDVLDRARAASGVECSQADFQVTVKAYGLSYSPIVGQIGL